MDLQVNGAAVECGRVPRSATMTVRSRWSIAYGPRRQLAVTTQPLASPGVRGRRPAPPVSRRPDSSPVGPTLVLDQQTVATPNYRQFLEALGVAMYTTDAEGRITFYNQAAVALWGRVPEVGEMWCGAWKLLWPNGELMSPDESPMAIALREKRSVRGYEGMAERPDGTRVSMIPYPTVVTDSSGQVIGAINILVDVTDRREAEDALRAAIAVKDEFLGLVSHELRTPVTTILGNARLLATRKGLDEPVSALLRDLGSEAEHLAGVVENLLVLTKAGTPVEMDREPQVLAHVVHAAVMGFARRHPGREIRLLGDVHDSIVDADRALLDLLLGNLLGNAHKFSPADTPLEIKLTAAEGALQVRFLDRGIGFDDAESDELFSTFYRSEAAQRTTSGLGIGLSACRRLVELLGGRIWAMPRSGGGSEFGFSLPAAVTAPD